MTEDYYAYLFFGITTVSWFIGSMWYAFKEKMDDETADIITPIMSALAAPIMGPLVAFIVAIAMPVVLVTFTFDKLICIIANKFRKNFNGDA